MSLVLLSLSGLPPHAVGASLLVKAREALFSESLLEAVEVSEREEALVALGHAEVEQSEEGTRLLTSVTELRRLDIGTLDSLGTLEGPGVVARLLDVSGRSGALLVEEVDGGLSVFLPYDGESVPTLEGYSESYYAARFGSQDSELMLLKANNIDMLDTDIGEVTPVAGWENSFGRSTTLQVGGNGKRAVVIEHLSRISTAMAIDLESGEGWYLSLPYTGADGAFSPDGERFVVVGSTPDGTHSIYWYDLMSGEISGSFQIAENAFVHEYYGEDTSFVLSGDSRYVVALVGDDLLWFNLESQAVERV